MFNFGFREVREVKKPNYNSIIADAEKSLRNTENIVREQERFTREVLSFADSIWAETMPAK